MNQLFQLVLPLKEEVRPSRTRPIAAILCLLAVLALAGCVSMADPENVQDRANEPSPWLTEGHAVGQTFVSHYDGLASAQVLPVVDRSAGEVVGGTLRIHLREGVEGGPDVASAKVNLAELEHNQPYNFVFPPIAGSRNKSYYFWLETTDAGGAAKVSVWNSGSDSYVEGSAYADGRRLPGDLVFKTFYSYDAASMLRDAVEGGAKNLRLIASVFALLVLPGFAYLTFFSHESGHRWSFPLVIGLSVSLVPVNTYYLTRIGIVLGEANVTGAFVALFIFVCAVALLTRPPWRGKWKRPSKEWAAFGGALAFVLAASASVRLIHLHDLVVPMWVDSVQHAEIVRLIVDRGGVPESFSPFVEVAPFSYHFGFHALVAFAHWLSGAEVTTSMLFVGQALNFAVVLAAYLLGTRLMGGRIAGLVSAASVGVFSTMPAYYASWGRYTQLAGMVILPVAMVLTIDALGRARKFPGVRCLALPVLAVSGLIVTHPRVTVFYLCFLLAYASVETAARRKDRKAISAMLASTAILGVAALVSVAPWLLTMASSLLIKVWQGASAAPPGLTPFPFDYFTSWVDRALVLLAVMGAVFAVAKRSKPAIMVLIWAGLMLLVANPQLIGLPGSAMVGNGAVAISLFLPVSLLAGYLAASVAGVLSLRKWPFPALVLGGLLLVAASYFGANRLAGVMNPSCVLFTRQDQEAVEWIRGSTPEDSVFLVNPRDWQLGVFVGSDGGYWIPVLTGRKTTLPSVLYAFGDQSSVSKVNAVARAVSEPGFAESDVWTTLKGEGVSYVYIGYRGGVLSPETFIGKPGFQIAYAKHGVWIFQLVERG